MWVFGKFGGKWGGSSRSVVTRYHSPHSPLSHLLENLDSWSRDILRFHSTLNISLKYRNISCPSHLSYVTNCGIEFPTSRLCFANWIIWSSRPAWQLDKNSQRTFRWGQLSKWQAEREREREQSQNYLFGDNLTNLVQDWGGGVGGQGRVSTVRLTTDSHLVTQHWPATGSAVFKVLQEVKGRERERERERGDW